jgi:hypothetical protein
MILDPMASLRLRVPPREEVAPDLGICPWLSARAKRRDGSGDPTGTRTPDDAVDSRVLYP